MRLDLDPEVAARPTFATIRQFNFSSLVPKGDNDGGGGAGCCSGSGGFGNLTNKL